MGESRLFLFIIVGLKNRTSIANGHMKNISNIIKYIIIVLVLIVLGLWIYIESHQPQLSGKVTLKQNTLEVDVYFDDYGIPHIYAENAADAYRTFGYIHAQDRLFQMELMRRVGSGNLAEIFGRDLVEADMLFRTIGTHRKAKIDAENFESLSTPVKEATLAYLEGVNAFISQGKIPLEYKLLGLEPDSFNVSDVYSISAYMAYSFAYALRTDPIVSFMQNTLGIEYLVDLDLGYVDTTKTIDFFQAPIDSNAVTLANLLPSDILDKLPSPVFQGSNSWAVGPGKSASGKVLLANDPHIKLASPSVWYEAHIEYPGFSFYGHFLAGIPVGMIGHSRNHAWGITMFEDDDCDFYLEKFQNSDSTQTVFRDSLSREVISYEEVIHIKGELDTTIIVQETVHGPIINRFLPPVFEQAVSMSWTYTKLENKLLEAFYRMNHTSHMDGFKSGVKKIGAPGLNVTYGDAAGNIAMWSAARLVIRPEGDNGKVFLDGSKGKNEFQGFFPFEDNPTIENPEIDLVWSANQKHDTIEGRDYPGYYAPDTRYDRIEEKLWSMTPLNVDSMKALILDNVSITEMEVAAIMAEVVMGGHFAPSDDEQRGLEILLRWDGSHDVDDIAPTLYYKMLYYSLKGAMQDELGPDRFKTFLTTFAFQRSYPKLFLNNDSPWWDNVETVGMTETRSNIFSKALQRSIAELHSEFGEEMEEWRWGEVHTITHAHPLGKVELLSPWFDVGPFPAPGGNETVNNAGFVFNGDGKYPMLLGPSFRNIIDFNDIENSVSILPTGNSGNVMSPHYNDQAQMYVDGEFRKMMMNKKEIIQTSTKILVKPGK
jgi:penicillin amidase